MLYQSASGHARIQRDGGTSGFSSNIVHFASFRKTLQYEKSRKQLSASLLGGGDRPCFPSRVYRPKNSNILHGNRPAKAELTNDVWLVAYNGRLQCCGPSGCGFSVFRLQRVFSGTPNNQSNVQCAQTKRCLLAKRGQMQHTLFDFQRHVVQRHHTMRRSVAASTKVISTNKQSDSI